MSSRTIRRCALVVMGLMMLSGGCQCTGTRRVYPPKINPHAGPDAITMFDTNGDGKLSGRELDKCPGLKAALERLDPSKSGAITADMIEGRIAAWCASGLGRTPVRCYVSHNGTPLQRLDVKFVPERFLGHRDQDGQRSDGCPWRGHDQCPARPAELPAGRAPGFYRIEITRSGLPIPARYNTDTLLGTEIAIDVAQLQNPGLRFDLDY